MVARIKRGNSISRALNYNEQKLAQGKAFCLNAENYLKDAADMNFYEKLEGLINNAELNQRVKSNSVHISLNFDNRDKIPDEDLKSIASDYMEQIGFKEQPYLVYKHLDAGHPHIHIVSTNIRFDGSRIDMHNIGRNQSESARKSLEIKYKLVQASAQKLKENQLLKPVKIGKALYGKAETKRAITNVLDHVLSQYKFASLPELNAVLKTFNVIADPGQDGSRIKKHQGLCFNVLDENGNKIGIPLKASLFYMRPTIVNLQKKFDAGKQQKQLHKTIIRSNIDSAFIANKKSLDALQAHLKTKGVDTLLRKNDAGFIYGITFVDHKTKCVFNGSDLGKEYTAAALQRKCLQDKAFLQSQKVIAQFTAITPDRLQNQKQKTAEITQQSSQQTVAEQLIKPELNYEQTPHELKKKKRKSKRQSQ
jgi:hypothetical protein